MNDQEFLSNVKKRSVTGAASYFARTLVLQGLGFVSILILSAFFQPEDFAVYGIVLPIISLLAFVSDIGLAAALVQKKAEPSSTDYQVAFTVQQILAWMIFALAIVLVKTGFVAAKTGSAGNWILLSLAFSFPLATLKTIPSIMLERRLDFSKLVLPQIVEQATFHLILIILAWRGSGVIAYAYAILLRSIFGVIVMNWLQSWPVGLSLDKATLKSLVGYGVKFQLNDFLARIKDQLFYLVLGFLMPLKDFGYVQWAKNWSMYPYNLTVQNVMSITFPTFSRLQAHPQALKRAIELSLYFITLFIFPILVGMIVLISPVIQLVPAYLKWQPAVVSLIFFSLSIGWSALSSPLTNTLNAIGHINQTLKLMVLWTGLTWVLTPLMILYFGYNGIALAAFLISFTSIAAIMMVKKSVQISVFPQVWPQFLAALGMLAVGYYFQSWLALGWLQLFFGGILLVALYGLLILVFNYQRLVFETKYLLSQFNLVR